MLQLNVPPERGFTLVEMLVVVTITGILLTLGVPAMRDIIERNVVSGQVNTLVGAVNLARAESIKRGVPVVVCRSTNAETADTPTCTDGTNWATGWMVFVDRNGDSALDTTGTDVVLRVQGAVSGSSGITQNAAAKMVFQPTGLLRSGASQFTFSPLSDRASQKRRVCVSLQGRTRVINNGTDAC